MDSSPNDNSSASAQDRQKRSRIVLSCSPCRASKLKCDRGQPCSQCAKKDRANQCHYAPKPERKRPAKGMSARLKRLEGMVREMMETEAAAEVAAETSVPKPGDQDDAVPAGPAVRGRVVRGENATTYVGATHCMAMLEDIEDLKSYFEQPDDIDEIEAGELDSAEVLLFARAGPRNREDLLSYLPERKVADRLITRYFSSMSPSQHIIHRPTFTRAYAKFWQDPSKASLHWIAQLFMMLGLGVLFNTFMNFSEVEGDSPDQPLDRMRLYKTCAGWALAWGKYAQPTITTLPAFLLYVESHFLFNRAAQTNCYILSGVCLRLMLKMGLHRDPSKLANISPFEGEMRRRMWNMAIQVELIVSFHMGLPSMLQGFETDTTVPRNLQDDDFDEDSVELPPSRPPSDYTTMTYPIYKTNILRIFGQIARQAHALAPPSYADVLKLDNLLRETWRTVPSFMQVRPLDECVGDPPMLLIQRFGIASLYNKSRCVLHRRYLAEAVPKREHDYSRKQCLESALTLLGFQHTIWEACKPGHVLSQNGWFISSLAVHDYLLAAMVLYLVVRNEQYSETGGEFDWMAQTTLTPTKAELTGLIKRSYYIWADVAADVPDVRKTADTLATMLAKLGSPVDGPAKMPGETPHPRTTSTGNSSSSLGTSTGAPSMDPSPMDTLGNDSDLFSTLGLGSTSGLGVSQAPLSLGQPAEAATSVNFPGVDAIAGGFSGGLDFDPSWMEETAATMDWRYLDISLAHSHDSGRNEDTGQTWMERPPPLEDLDMMGPGGWGQAPSGNNF
ncbi:fungal-specific transcription factor domain-containing protein [Ilyonectria sp. MPI-CAGE-AT-0026]|nr:fungal-specific transcription factor domain-containing protein [Ilyonectria sp. MPI-CAGE-AT-0026]